MNTKKQQQLSLFEQKSREITQTILPLMRDLERIQRGDRIRQGIRAARVGNKIGIRNNKK